MTNANSIEQNRAANNYLGNFHRAQAYKGRGMGFPVELFTWFCYPSKDDNSDEKPNLVITNNNGLNAFIALADNKEDAGKGAFELNGETYMVHYYLCTQSFQKPIKIGLIVTEFNDIKELTKNQRHVIWAYKHGLVNRHDLLDSVDYTSDPLHEQQLRRLANLETGKRYSMLTHKFLNLVRIWNPATEVDFTGYGSGKLTIDATEFILPMGERLILGYQDNSQIRRVDGYFSPKLTRYTSLQWANSTDPTKGLVSADVGVHDVVSTSEMIEEFIDPIRRYTQLLLRSVPSDLEEGEIGNRTLQIVTGDDKSLDLAMEHGNGKVVGSISILKDENGKYFLSPLTDEKDAVESIYIYDRDYGFGDYRLRIPSIFNRKETVELFKDFFKYIDYDVVLKTGSLTGGGYACGTVRIQKLYHRFTQCDVDSNVIVLGDEITVE